jgi:Thiamine pyrophosphate-requiring enzymes [acetolactate synthase, pyruvate dehydrogenase (cytochrome), glyoxylate carboligase, phosphonopyruvate decarboxylase]
MQSMSGAELVIRCWSVKEWSASPGFPAARTCLSTTPCPKVQPFVTSWPATSRARASSPRAWPGPRGGPPVFFAHLRTREPPTRSRPWPTPKLDSVPVICITGQVSRPFIGTDAFQEVDIYGMSIPVTKHNFLVRSVEDLPRVITESFRIAASGRPGPVLVDIPKDVQTATIVLSTLPEPAGPDPVEPPDAESLTRAARMIDEAERPILLLGGGVAASGASRAAFRLAERAGLPTAMSLLGLGAMPEDHPLHLGMLGMHGARCVNMLMEECDLLLVAGARLDDRGHGSGGAFLSQGQAHPHGRRPERNWTSSSRPIWGSWPTRARS